ncbi:MAG: tetratricopeptide repeat protein [Methanobrevibacter olleyae]|uniref:Tetratricopeptide repeat protein n=1 Tax=Methanobrevibacter olleyae TaxID=294671 RepID=A0A8T3VLW6_METOL|nr:tetratricopeptide repeat protein [Methanobrevibacter olleyae]
MIKEIEIGDIIGLHSEVIKKSSGAFGTVFICKDIRYDITYALKTFHDKYIGNDNEEEIIKLFEQEAWNWIDLNQHPNIVAAYDFMNLDYRHFLMLEAICPENGKQSLTDYLNDDLDELTVIDWGIQFAYGMEYAHSHGIKAHRDLKPDNILINNDNILKISDFGLADFLDKTFNVISKSEEEYYRFYGTEAYSAPECFDSEYSIQSDIYSFGIIFYQITNKGDLPFYAEYFEDYEILHKTKKPKKLNSDLWPIISKCLEKDSNDRYENFTEIKKDLINLFSKKSDKKPYKPTISQDKSVLGEYAEKNLHFGFNTEAEAEYRKAIEEDPNNFIIQFNLAVSLLNNEKIEEAKNILKKLENKDYLIPELYYNLGYIYTIKEDHEKAVEYYKLSIDLSIDSFDYLQAYINLANEFRIMGEPMKSIIYLKKALSLKQKCLMIANNLTLSYLENNNFKEAKELFKNFEEKIKNNDFIGNEKEVSGFYYIWGKLYLNENNYQKSIAFFTESLKYDEDNIETHLDLTFVEMKCGMNTEEKLKELIKKYSDNRLKYLLANLYFIYRKFHEGIEIYNQLIIDEFYLVNNFFILNYLLPKKEYSKLLISFNNFINKNLENNEDDITLLTFKGMILIDIGNFEEADKNLDNILKIEAKNEIEEKYREIYLHSMGGC